MGQRYSEGGKIRGQHGMVLVIVLWIVTLLAIMAGSFAYSMRVETQLATTAVARARARALAEAGVAYALAWQSQTDPEMRKKWPPNGDPHDWQFGGAQLRIRVVDARGFVSLNSADASLLKALLAGVGVDPRDQDRLVDIIQDWRRQGDERLPNGAKSAEYRAAGRPGPKSAFFESVEELQQILGVTPEIYTRLAGAVTAFSRHYGVNPEFAPAEVLRLLGLDDQVVTDYLATRARNAEQNLPTPPPTTNQPFFSSGSAGTYHITVSAETDSGVITELETVVTGGVGSPEQRYRVLSWREGR